MSILAAALLSLLPTLIPTQEGAVSPPEVAAAESQREVYQDLLRRYNNDVGSHRFDCRKLKRDGVPQDQWPESPLFSYYPRFVELAQSGNGWAQYWVVANVANVVEDPVEQRKRLVPMYELLARDNARGAFMGDVIEELGGQWRVLGEERTLALLRRLGEGSGDAEVEASALLAEAALRWKNGKPESEEDRAAAVDLWQVLVDGYAGTEAAEQAAFALFARTEHAFRKAQHAWLRTVRELAARGVGEEGWPPYPIDAYRGQFQALASAGHGLASYDVDVFYPAYEQAQRAGVVPMLRFLSDDISARYMISEWPWMDLKFDLLETLFQLYPDEPWVHEEVTKLLDPAPRFGQERYLPLLEGLIERTSDARVRDEARMVLAHNLEAGATFAEKQRALELYDQVIAESPIERQRKDAERLRREFSWVMPGADLTDFSATDGEGLEVQSSAYRGKVLLMFFWGFWSPESMDAVPWMNELHERYVGRPFSILGFNTDTISLKAYRNRATKADIAWRSVLETRRRGPRVTLLRVSHFPTTLVVDAEGVIRGRNLDRVQTEALVEELLAEVEGGAPVKAEEAPEAGQGERSGAAEPRGLRGRVLFDGPRGPLPPLRISAGQSKGCCEAGHEVDSTNRKRLVDAEGGLANVVVYVEVDGARADGRGTEVVLDQHACRFEPHVSVVPVGAKLVVRNSDEVSHNVNMNSRYSGRINEMMPASTQRTIELSRKDRLTIACDVHPWMSSHVFVMESPYWALTGADGRFEIPDLPPGDYVARYWHEELGESKSERFSVDPGEVTELELEVSAKKGRRGGRRPR